MTVRARLQGALPKLLLLSLSLVFTILALEVGLRAFWDDFYVKDRDPYVTATVTRGWRNLPDTVARRGESEFAFVASHDALGHRHDPRTVGRASVQKRIFVLGDSFTYGVGVDDDETFCARVEQLDSRLELINGGVDGYGTGQQLLMLREEGGRVGPDAVLVTFFWNDIGNNLEDPRFRLVDGTLIDPAEMPLVAPTRDRSERRKILRNSYAYRFLSDRLKTAKFLGKVWLGLPMIGETEWTEPRREEAWALSRALLGEIRDEAARLGAITILTLIPDQVLIESDVRVVGFEPAAYDIEDRVREIAGDLGIPFVDLVPALRAEFEAGGARLYYRKDRHLTVRGNQVVAKALQRGLDELLFEGSFASSETPGSAGH